MSSSAFAFPVGFSWLSPVYRPSEKEVTRYAAVIATREGLPPDQADTVRSEAELQLWVWRSENRRRSHRRRAA